MNEASMSGRIEALRVKLGFSQTDMGRELGVSAMSVSRYERGTNEPPSNVFVKLALLASSAGEDGWIYLNHIGMTRVDARRALRH
jgi:transcriptional regulator with XRE-family HTH domain